MNEKQRMSLYFDDVLTRSSEKSKICRESIFMHSVLVLIFFFSRSIFAQSLQEDAKNFAVQGLHENVVPCNVKSNGEIEKCVVAGAHQYHSFWARDFAWASAGVIQIGEASAVRKSLEIELNLMNSDGLLPRGFDHLSNGLRFILGNFKIKASFFAPFYGTYLSENKVVTLDTNTLIPWAANQYIQKTGDREFAERFFRVAEASIQYLQRNYVTEGLIDREPPYADWEDSVRRTGSVAYTNATYLMSLKAMKEWAHFLGMEAEENRYQNLADFSQKQFFEKFWEADQKRLLNFDGDTHLTMDANLIAVVYDLVPRAAAIEIMSTLRASPLWQPFPGKVTFPDFPKSMKSFLPRFSGTGHYHDSQYWLWLSSLAARAEHKLDEGVACERILDQISEVVINSKGVQENYELRPSGKIKPVKRLLYRAEVPFTWSSGMLIEAINEGCKPLNSN